MRARKPAFRWIALLALGVALLFHAGCTSTPTRSRNVDSASLRAEEKRALNITIYDRAADLVTRKFYDPKFNGVDWLAAVVRHREPAAAASDEPAFYRELNALLEELKVTHLYAASSASALEYHRNESMRIGLKYLKLGEQFVVVEVLPKSPAEDAGIKPGWVVLRRGGAPFSFALKRQQKEETLTWDFLDGADNPVTLQLTPRVVTLPTRNESRVLANNTLYLRLDGFSRASRQWLSATLKRHRDVPSLVLDLRGNGGGGAFSLDIIIGEFFPKAVPYGAMIERDGDHDKEDSWMLGSARYPGKIVVIVDGGSASCAEILAATIQESGRGVIVGRPTAKAVLLSFDYRLPDDGLLQIPVRDFVTAKGRRLEGAGVTPDVPVTLTRGDFCASHDVDLQAALNILGGEEMSAVSK